MPDDKGNDATAPPEELLGKVFGSEAKSIVKICLIGALILAAAKYGVSQGESLLNPAFRWLVEGIVCALCIIALVFDRQEEETVIQLSENKKARIPNKGKRRTLLYITWFFSIALISDIAFSLSPFLRIIDLSEPVIVRSVHVAYLSPGDAQILAAQDVNWFFSTSPARLPIEDGSFFPSGDLALHFDIRKRQNVEDDSIEDVVVKVVSFTPVPNAKIRPAHGAYIEELHLFYELKKRGDQPPWEFSPSYALLDGKFRKWEQGLVVLRNNFPTRVYVHLASEDDGLYGIQLYLKAGPHFAPPKRIPVLEKTTNVLFAIETVKAEIPPDWVQFDSEHQGGIEQQPRMRPEGVKLPKDKKLPGDHKMPPPKAPSRE
jgi:hypothetical protein